MFNKFKKENKNKKNKNVDEIFAKIIYVFQAKAINFVQNSNFEYVRNAIARFEYINEEKNVVAIFEIAFKLMKIVFASIAIARNSISTKNN